MKKLIYISLLLLLGAGCKKEGLLTYDIADNIYFAYRFKIVQNPIIDTTSFTFAYSPLSVTDSIFKLPVAVTGLAKEQDRAFNITVNAASTATAGKHYEMPSTFVLHAGRLTDTILIRLKRPADLKADPVSLLLDLSGGSTFGTNLKRFYASADTVEALQFKVNISDNLVAGSSWNGTFAPYFGTFSVKKVLLMNEVAGMRLDFFIDFNVGGINLNALCQLYAITTSRYLKDEAAAGRTVYEEDGVTPMAMAPAYQ